jgi:hypothetical protein
MMTDIERLASDELWVLVEQKGDVGDEIARFAGRTKFSVERLGSALNEFTGKLSQALGKIEKFSDEFELSEVSVDASLSVEFGFELIGKSGLEGGITLTFQRITGPRNQLDSSTHPYR